MSARPGRRAAWPPGRETARRSLGVEHHDQRGGDTKGSEGGGGFGTNGFGTNVFGRGRALCGHGSQRKIVSRTRVVANAAVIVTSPLTRGRGIATPMLTDVRRIRFGASSDLRFSKSTARPCRLRTALLLSEGKNTACAQPIPRRLPESSLEPIGTFAGSCWKRRASPRSIGSVAETIEALERRIDELRVAVREAVLAGDQALASARRAELKRAEQAWEDALAATAPKLPQATAGRKPRGRKLQCHRPKPRCCRCASRSTRPSACCRCRPRPSSSPRCTRRSSARRSRPPGSRA